MILKLNKHGFVYLFIHKISEASTGLILEICHITSLAPFPLALACVM
jgi:hypothetical protein